MRERIKLVNTHFADEAAVQLYDLFIDLFGFVTNNKNCVTASNGIDIRTSCVHIGSCCTQNFIERKTFY